MSDRDLPIGGIAASLLLILIVQLAWFMGQEPLRFADGDSYLRLLRVEQLLATGNWLDAIIADANAPFGFELHWSRPFDLMMLLLALPTAPVLGWEDAIRYAGVWISPVLHVVTAIVILWALPPLLGRVGTCVAAGLTATQVSFLSFAVIGRADHHMVFPVIVVLIIGFLVRAFETGDRAQAGRAGMATAFGIWVGPEFMIVMAVLVALLGIRWLIGAAGALALNRSFSIGLAVGLAIALLVERGGHVLAIEYDRLSLFHVACVGMVVMFWAVIEGLAARKPNMAMPARIGLTIAGATLMALVTVLVFPGALGYPFAEVDPDFMRIQSAISDYAATTAPRSLLLYLGPAMIALPWAAYRALTSDQRWSWMLLLVMLLVFAAFTLGWLRWSLYPAILSVILLADILSEFDRRVNRRFTSMLRVLIKIPVIAALVFGPAAAVLAIPVKQPDRNQVTCPVDELSEWLEDTYAEGPPRTIVAAANFGPEILYRTRHRVLATLSHRNTDGILDGYRMMISNDMDAVRAMIGLRGIDLIVICPNAGAESYIRRDLAEGALHTRLLLGPLPEGFREVRLSGDRGGPFRIFETAGARQ